MGRWGIPSSSSVSNTRPYAFLSSESPDVDTLRGEAI